VQAELTRLGCDLAQGHWVCPALSAAALRDWWSQRAAGS